MTTPETGSLEKIRCRAEVLLWHFSTNCGLLVTASVMPDFGRNCPMCQTDRVCVRLERDLLTPRPAARNNVEVEKCNRLENSSAQNAVAWQ